MSSETTPTAAAPGATAIDGIIEDVDNQLPPLPNPLPTPHPEFVACMPPDEPKYRDFSVFLAGSIEMGKAINWQTHMTANLQHLPLTVLNPRRGRWDQNTIPLPSDQTFRTQVEWELSALEKASVICFFFDKNTKSPVTMLELGLWAHSGKVVVCCDKGFWKAGNIWLVCEREGIPIVGSFRELVPEITKMLKQKGMQIPN
ncbi:hypothetical protein BCR34DRAFT_557634 [Clohesyomyces aquaticus]|uniref:Uncharacterized protein n=1 Tax=Clohesyomyces aquaticus TaxID=1231657 RepID=A0A1Y2A1N9_9PLEO|nr:hypothetical protein BCR34DRAFT_557634 [Clohesyomyces aquaticus]